MMRVSQKPRSKAIDSLSCKRWQNTWVWHYTVGVMPQPKRLMSDRTANILVTIFIIAMSALAVGIIRELYLATQCINWQNVPLDQVATRCM